MSNGKITFGAASLAVEDAVIAPSVRKVTENHHADRDRIVALETLLSAVISELPPKSRKRLFAKMEAMTESIAVPFNGLEKQCEAIGEVTFIANNLSQSLLKAMPKTR